MVRQAGAHRPRGRRRSNECRIRGNLEGKLFQRNGRSGICGENNIDMEEARVSISISRWCSLQCTGCPRSCASTTTTGSHGLLQQPQRCVLDYRKLANGDTCANYPIASMNEGIALEYGNTVFRDLVGEGVVTINPAPSLLYSTISLGTTCAYCTTPMPGA
ncbi:hypothetical protein PF010_g5395 [Phytophthora fragariae]|uniref:Uncharacterized protein n=1 Tax=Phytophthora fragariae TaxID=53985 RepID=A0A6G0PF84_9STRA|nr:hypothetical protein PF010_g5395 [Phytophthora fragariae]KAE9244402.1 hypothetical protein PF004_g5694 [Phytophthora fragariae]